MAPRRGFAREVNNLLQSVRGSSINSCLQCGTCSVSCPVARYMDKGPRLLIAMIKADLRDEVMASNTFWYCASCYQCVVRCPAGIDIADMMYALKRYSVWRGEYKQDMIGPKFERNFMQMIMRTGKSYEPALAPVYMLTLGPRGIIQEGEMGSLLLLKGRMPVLPSRIKRIKNFRRMVQRIIPMGAPA